MLPTHVVSEARGGLGGGVDLAADALLQLARELPIAAPLPDPLQQSAHAWRMHQHLLEVQRLQVKMWTPAVTIGINDPDR